MIGKTITIKGEVTGEENLVIEGRVEGKISLNSHDVTIGESGRIKADVIAKVIKIDGEVQGDMIGQEKITISKTGNVRGNLIAPRVTLEDGANFKGSIDMDPAGSKAVDKSLTAVNSAPRPQRISPDPVRSEAVVNAHGG